MPSERIEPLNDSDEPRRTEDVPHNRLTRICDAMTNTFDAHPEHHDDDKCIVFLDGDNQGGLVLHGYDSDIDAMVNLIGHLTAVFEANGKRLEVIAVPDDVSGITDVE